MKKFILPLILLVTVSSVYVGCKKGPDDPFFTIKSRQGRMVGVWKVSSYAVNGYEYISGDTTLSIPSGSCGTLTTKLHSGINMTFEFKDNGEYTTSQQDTTVTTLTYSAPSATCVNGTTTDVGTTSITSGNWTFAGGVGDYKNKEQLVISSWDASSGSEVSDVIDIVKLSSKQIVLTYSITDPANSTVTKVDIIMDAVK